MAKKTNPQILSPENYIRQRVRNLPLHKCFINEGWEDIGMSEIIVSRKHINGNVTLCFYLVDKDCLGIKDSFYRFNIPEYEMDEIIGNLDESMPMIEVDYNLVHNIIHAAWEFAEEIGFKPYKDFLYTTQYMLEEDSEDIPIIEIQCGDEYGRPIYTRGPNDSDARVRQIINQMKKTLGEGNYTVILNPYDEDFEYENEYYEIYAQKNFEENVENYLELYPHIENFLMLDYKDDRDFIKKLEALSDVLYEEIVTNEELNKWFDKWEEEEKNIRISEKEYSHEILGLTKEQTFTKEDLRYLENAETLEETYEYITKRWGEVPYSIYMFNGDETMFDKTKKESAKLLKQFPEYSLFKMDDLIFKISEKKAGEECLDYKSIFKNRKEIAPFEYIKFILLKANFFTSRFDLAGVESLYLHALDFLGDWETEDRDSTLAILLMSKLSVLWHYLLENFHPDKK